jgi:hypothetical protein
VVSSCPAQSYLVLVGTEAKVLDSLTVVLGATQEQGVSTGGLLKSKLVKGQGAAASSQDAGAGGGGEAQGSDLDLGDLEQAVVVGDGADNDDCLLVVAVLQVGLDTRQGDGRAVDAGGKQAAQDNLVEGRVGTTCRWRVVSKKKKNTVGSSGGLDRRRCLDLRARKRYSFTRSLRYALSLLGALRWVLRTWWRSRSIPTKRQKFPRQPLAQVCSDVCGSTRKAEGVLPPLPAQSKTPRLGRRIGSAIVFAETVSDRPLAYKGLKEI